jgi:hypothetical protein
MNWLRKIFFPERKLTPQQIAFLIKVKNAEQYADDKIIGLGIPSELLDSVKKQEGETLSLNISKLREFLRFYYFIRHN